MSTFLAWFWFIGLVTVGILYLVEKLQRSKETKHFSLENKRLQHEGQQLSSKVSELSKYEGIADIEGQIATFQQQFESYYFPVALEI